MERKISSVDDIDAMLEEEFGLTDSNDDVDSSTIIEEDGDADKFIDNDINDDSSNTTDSDDNSDTDEDTTDNNNESKTEQIESANKKDSQKDYTFEKMRKEIKELKESKEKLSKEEAFVKELASLYKYDDIESFKNDFKKSLLTKEAEEKKIPADVYITLKEQERKIKDLEAAEGKKAEQSKLDSFIKSVDNIVSSYELGANGREKVFDKLDEAGYTVEDILRLPNYDLIVKGVLTEEITEYSKVQLAKKQNKLNGLDDEKHNNTQTSKTMSLDDLIAAEMKEYAKNM